MVKQHKKPASCHHAVLRFSDGAIREVGKVAHARGTGARDLRSIVERVVEGILFDPKPWTTYLITEEAVRGGEVQVIDILEPVRGPREFGEPGRTAEASDGAAVGGG